MTSTVLPRPIAWVTSRSPAGVVNLAPFSYFNAVSATPPLLSVSIGDRRDGTPKDTRRNIVETGAFVVHVVDESHAHVMVDTSAEFSPDESEVEAVGLKLAPSEVVDVPRLLDAPVAMECLLEHVWSPQEGGVGLVIGRIVAWHVRDALLLPSADGPEADVHRLRPVARLGQDQYCPVREVFSMQRPR